MMAYLVSNGSFNSLFSSPNEFIKSNVSSTPGFIAIVISEVLQIYEENNSCNFSSCSLGIFEFTNQSYYCFHYHKTKESLR